jgi:hypothetical protein
LCNICHRPRIVNNDCDTNAYTSGDFVDHIKSSGGEKEATARAGDNLLKLFFVTDAPYKYESVSSVVCLFGLV